ncbi:MAG: glutathione synthase/RimK-type ligase-like ATP-grasp enzyme [Candidatus Nanohaloarchaea archaeon]
MIPIRLLTISKDKVEGFEDFFDEVTEADISEVSPEVIKGERKVSVGEEFVEEYDAVYTQIPPQNSVFGRVLLETIEEKEIPVDNYSTAYFTAAKKNYLYYVLSKRDINCPKTVSVASEKAVRNIDQHLDFPVLGRRLEELKETEKRKLESGDEIKSFSEGTEYEEDVLLFQELNEDTKYRCLVIDGEIISLREGSEDWKFNAENLKYSNISDTQKDIIKQAYSSIGLGVVEILIRGEEIYDINPNPDLELYSEKAGKNIFSEVADLLKRGSV